MDDDTTALLAELEAELAHADDESRPLLAQQISALRDATQALERVRAAAPPAPRAALTAEMAAFFTPEPPAEVPTWLADDLQRGALELHALRCPPGARVYEHDEEVGCGIAAAPGEVGVRHGLQLGFYRASGRLKYQRFYERGLCRWAVEYHASGGRAQVAFYVDDERFQYRVHGIHTAFASNGTIVSQAHHFGGVQHGWAKLWEPDGYPIAATLHVEGREIETVLPDGSRRPVGR